MTSPPSVNSAVRDERSPNVEWLGALQITALVSNRVLTMGAILFTVALIVLLSTGQYTRSTTASGMLVPAGGLLELKAVTAGTVTWIDAKQGDLIRADQALVTISSEQASAAVGKTDAAVTGQLTLQRLGLEVDLENLKVLAFEKRSADLETIRILTAQWSRSGAEVALKKQQADNARALVERIKPYVVTGAVSRLQAQQLERDALEAEAQVFAVTRERLETEKELALHRNELLQLPLLIAAQRHELERRRSDLEQAFSRNEVKRESVLYSPQDGSISSVLVSHGQSVDAGRTLLVIVPKNSRLIAQIFLPSRACGFVTRGSRVVLRYQAYPYQKFGLHVGRITNISQNALSPLQVTTLLGPLASEPMYRIEVEIDSQTVNAYGAAVNLRPGTAVEAEVQLDKRSLLEWLFEPLYGTRKKLLRT